MAYSQSILKKTKSKRRKRQDNSGYTPQQRHDIIMETLASFNKGPEAFQMRWTAESGEYLTGDILLQTPMFWFMKYKWSRKEIESLFYKARIVINDDFDIELQQTFGGRRGKRWRGTTQSPISPSLSNENQNDIYLNIKLKSIDHSDSDQTEESKEETTDCYQINIQCPDGNQLTLNVQSMDTLNNIKQQIAEQTNSKFSEFTQSLVFNDCELFNNGTLQHYGIENGDYLQLCIQSITIIIEQLHGMCIYIFQCIQL